VIPMTESRGQTLNNEGMKPLCYSDVIYGCHRGEAQIAETEASDATRLKRYADRSTYYGQC